MYSIRDGVFIGTSAYRNLADFALIPGTYAYVAVDQDGKVVYEDSSDVISLTSMVIRDLASLRESTELGRIEDMALYSERIADMVAILDLINFISTYADDPEALSMLANELKSIKPELLDHLKKYVDRLKVRGRERDIVIKLKDFIESVDKFTSSPEFMLAQDMIKAAMELAKVIVASPLSPLITIAYGIIRYVISKVREKRRT